ncbi:hypothetical protein BDP27DRAFT_111621 [Rhodocollybia butyracea]|uniref:Uncharacterized protein n=1 Tax=Rhodocollybia butyracea TaxID=206335 RepID=A0A9P5U2R6_9AGAR|nr:hypothetical protein BDP27DRAFT_111621 [Rhodocollybia butyracea]
MVASRLIADIVVSFVTAITILYVYSSKGSALWVADTSSLSPSVFPPLVSTLPPNNVQTLGRSVSPLVPSSPGESSSLPVFSSSPSHPIPYQKGRIEDARRVLVGLGGQHSTAPIEDEIAEILGNHEYSTESSSFLTPDTEALGASASLVDFAPIFIKPSSVHRSRWCLFYFSSIFFQSSGATKNMLRYSLSLTFTCFPSRQ